MKNYTNVLLIPMHLLKFSLSKYQPSYSLLNRAIGLCSQCIRLLLLWSTHLP